MKRFVLITAFCCSLINISQAQITRGALPGEIYISNEWYLNNDDLHYAILYSMDNGENFQLKYQNLETPPPGEMQIGKVLGDATQGALYNYGNNELWVSFNYGENWEYREDYPGYTKFFSGVNLGLIFKANYQGLFKSTDYAFYFELLPITVTCPFTEVGFSESEFYGIYGEPGIYYNFVHTLDYGQTYSEIPIDSTVAFWEISGKYPEISRGTEPGELYLVSWWLDMNFKIFHSVDTGYTWVQQYESSYISLYHWGVQYTAGSQAGSFYVKRACFDPASNHTLLYIDYSSDYGKTFTTYFHDLDSLYTSADPLQKPSIKSVAFPNPFYSQTTISYSLPQNCKTAVLNIFNFQGTLIIQYNIKGTISIQWDGRNSSGNSVPDGIYLYNLNFDNVCSQYNKIIFNQ